MGYYCQLVLSVRIDMENGLGRFASRVMCKILLMNVIRYIIYTSLFNMIDYPAMAIPLRSQVSVELDPVDKDFKAANQRDAAMQAQCESSKSYDIAARASILCPLFLIGLASLPIRLSFCNSRDDV